jgi:formamidopyrimidine-DNA glycosylase
MPELPDLALYARNLDKALRGDRIARVDVAKPNKANAPAQVLTDKLGGRALTQVVRDGKQLLFCFDGAALAVHQMLTGKLEWLPAGASAKTPIATLVFERAGALLLRDRMGLANIHLNPAPASTPDALDAALTPAYLSGKFAKDPARSIKEALLDQAVVRGIGNAYADEVLWHARIHPASPARALPADAVVALHAAIGTTLRSAIDALECATPDAINGEYREFLAVHHAKRSESPTGAAIHVIDVAGKKTYFTAEQRLYAV